MLHVTSTVPPKTVSGQASPPEQNTWPLAIVALKQAPDPSQRIESAVIVLVEQESVWVQATLPPLIVANAQEVGPEHVIAFAEIVLDLQA